MIPPTAMKKNALNFLTRWIVLQDTFPTTSEREKESMAADPVLMEKIKKILCSKFNAMDALVDVVASGIRDNIHVRVISRAFDGMSEKQKQEYLWGALDDSDLSEEEKLHIKLALAITPEEL